MEHIPKENHVWVKHIQQLLTDRGYKDNLGRFGIDGYYGKETQFAVMKFQKDTNCKYIDGLAGSETVSKLKDPKYNKSILIHQTAKIYTGNCKNCGAPLIQSGKCEYCGTQW